jgi:hypothetical protein
MITSNSIAVPWPASSIRARKPAHASDRRAPPWGRLRRGKARHALRLAAFAGIVVPRGSSWPSRGGGDRSKSQIRDLKQATHAEVAVEH